MSQSSESMSQKYIFENYLKSRPQPDRPRHFHSSLLSRDQHRVVFNLLSNCFSVYLDHATAVTAGPKSRGLCLSLAEIQSFLLPNTKEFPSKKYISILCSNTVQYHCNQSGVSLQLFQSFL